MSRIFISYRREETAYPAGWLFDRLGARFGEEQIFKDVDSIDPGDDFVERITTAVAACDVLLVLIGDEWLAIEDEHGGRRLDNADDFVRLEVEAGLARDVLVVPVLVDGAAMPEADELPASLAPLARRQALELSPQRFDFDTNRLLDVLEGMVADGEATELSGAGTSRPLFKPRGGASGPRFSRHALISAGLAGVAVLVLVPLLVFLLRPDERAADTTPTTPIATATSTPTQAGERWTAQANEICERANEAIDDLPAPSAANLETLGIDAFVGYGEAALNVNKRMVRDLGELTPPPSDEPALRELVLRGAALTEAAEELFAAWRVGDIEAVQRQQAALSTAGTNFDAKALELGATTCAEGASLDATALPTG